MKYCDLHCDTPLELYLRGESLCGSSLNVTVEGFAPFESYVQVAAYCVMPAMSNGDGYDAFFKVREYFLKDAEKCSCRVVSCASELTSSVNDGIPAFILAVEDARILDGDISRLEVLAKAGVRILTPLWGGESCIGGSHESSSGLTPFGRMVCKECAKLGIITDISHASHRSAFEILDIAAKCGGSVMASHSCAASVHAHSRNLTDELAAAVAASGGVVGVNTYPPHLTGSTACLDDALRHIEHYVNTIGEDSVCLGCDFDGMGIFTEGCENISRIPSLYEKISFKRNEHLADKVFFSNGVRFLKDNLSGQL